MRDAERNRDTRILPLAEAQEVLHRAEADARATSEAVEAVREALERRKDLARA